MTLIAFTLALAVACCPLVVPASPKTAASAAQATLSEAIARFDAARARLAEIQAATDAGITELDDLVATQTEAETRLGERAREIYRTGPLGFLEVLVGAASFEQFLTTWDALVRLERSDARTVADVKAARKRVTGAVVRLVRQQEQASRELRALDAAKADARRRLASSQAALAAYRKQIAVREAVAAVRPQSSSSQSNPTGSAAPWKSAVASHYGTGSYGIHLSSGFTIGPDSMIVAHKTLRFGTVVEFSYNGRTAVATVADRGPYYPGREFDLGPGTARVLGFRGVHQVRYRVLGR